MDTLKDIEKITSNDTDIVIYSNEFNSFSTGMFSAKEQDLLAMIMANLRNDDCSCELEVHQIKETIQETKHINQLNKFLYDFGKKMMSFVWTKQKGGSFSIGTIFYNYSYNDETGKLNIDGNNEFMRILEDISGNFTMFSLEDHVSVRGKNEKALFRLLSQWKTQGYSKWYTIDELRIMFGRKNTIPREMLRDITNASDSLVTQKIFKSVTVNTKYGAGKGSPLKEIQFKFK